MKLRSLCHRYSGGQLASDVTVEVNETSRGHLEADGLGIWSICGPWFVTDPHIRTGHM